MKSFENYNILFIAPETFGLAAIIINKLKAKGARIKYFRENVGRNSYLFYKQCVRLLSLDMVAMHRTYYQNIIKTLKREDVHYDALFVIRGEYMTPAFIKEVTRYALKKNAIKVLYLWDSFANLNNIKNIQDCFDYRFSFDSVDCKCNNNYQLLPLFWEKRMIQADTKEWDLSFIGSFYDDRYERLKLIYDSNQILKMYIKMYLSQKGYISRSIFVYKSFHHLDCNLLINHPIPREKMYGILTKSKATLDVQSLLQSGLTLRTIESVGSNQKIVTTNPYVKEYDFYQYGNIFLLENGNWEVDKDWLEQPPNVVPDEIQNSYSLETWLDTLFTC